MRTEQAVLVHGATDGIGREVALQLARRGDIVFATGSQQKSLVKLRQDARGLDLQAIRVNASDAESIAKLKQRVNRTTQDLGLDTLINNTGCELENRPLAQVGLRDQCTQLERGLLAMVSLLGAFIPQMRLRGWGRIINICPTSAKFAQPVDTGGRLFGGAAKALSFALRRELAPFGIDVAVIERNESGPVTAGAVSDPSPEGAGIVECQPDDEDSLETQPLGQLTDSEVINQAVALAVRSDRTPGAWLAAHRDQATAKIFRVIHKCWVDQVLRVLAIVSGKGSPVLSRLGRP